MGWSTRIHLSLKANLSSFCTDDKWHFILFIQFYYFWPDQERYCSHPIPVPLLFCPVTLFSVYLYMYDYKYIVVKWICTVWRGLCIYGEDSCQSQNCVHIKRFDTSKIFCLRLLQPVWAANRIRSKFTAAQTLLYCKYGLYCLQVSCEQDEDERKVDRES